MFKLDKYIYVYSQDGELLATYSSAPTTGDGLTERDILSTPTTRIVVNGESTLTFAVFSDSEKWHFVSNPSNLWHCDGRVYIANQQGAFVDDGNVVTVTLVEQWYELGSDYGQVHNVDTDIEALDDHTIKILPKTSSKFKMTVNGREYSDDEIRDSRGVLLPRGSAGYALWGVLKANKFGWKIGICDVIVDGFDVDDDYGTQNLETDMKDLRHNIEYIRELWGGILIWDSKNKIVHLRDETHEGSDFNTWKGFEVAEGKNLEALPIVTIDNNIITRAYILGNGNLNIKDVNNDLGYIENFSYTKRILSGYLVNPNIYWTGTGSDSGQKQLLFWGERELEKMCKPREQIEANIIDRSDEFEYSHETFEIADLARITYFSPLEQKEVTTFKRIISIEKDVFNNGSATITVGDKMVTANEFFRLIYNDAVIDSPNFDNNGDYSGEDIYVDLGDGEFGSTTHMFWLYKQKTTANSNAIAGINISVTEINAQLDLFTEFQEETVDAFIDTNSRITLLSNELGSQISLFTQFQKDTAQSFLDTEAYIDLVSTELQASIDLKVSYTVLDTTINSLERDIDNAMDDAVDRAAVETNAQIVAFADGEGASVGILATKTDIEGRFGYGYLEVTDDSMTAGVGGGWSSHLYVIESYIKLEAERGFIDILSFGDLTLEGSYIYLEAANDIELDAKQKIHIEANQDVTIFSNHGRVRFSGDVDFSWANVTGLPTSSGTE